MPLTFSCHPTTLVSVLGAVGGVGLPLTVIMTKLANELIGTGMNHPGVGGDGVLADMDFLTWHLWSLVRY